MFTSSTRDIPEPRDVPRHVAIIMDGNGRWAKKRLLPRVAGHRRGVEAVRSVVRACIERTARPGGVLLINNSGIGDFGAFAERDVARQLDVFHEPRLIVDCSFAVVVQTVEQDVCLE